MTLPRPFLARSPEQSIVRNSCICVPHLQAELRKVAFLFPDGNVKSQEHHVAMIKIHKLVDQDGFDHDRSGNVTTRSSALDHPTDFSSARTLSGRLFKPVSGRGDIALRGGLPCRKDQDMGRMKIVTDSMYDYRQYGRVQEIGCDAIIAFAREGALA
jgi:hypothetical protein